MRLHAAPFLILAAGPGFAGLAGGADPAACVAGQISANAPVADCVNAAHVLCLGYAPGSPAGTACFIEARGEWSAMLRARMDEIRAIARDEIAAIAAIEAKYDVLQNLTQCDRMSELARVRDDAPADRIQWLDARCEATAIGLAFVKLMLQSQNLKAGPEGQ